MTNTYPIEAIPLESKAMLEGYHLRFLGKLIWL